MDIMKKGEHLTTDGLLKIVGLKALFKLGLSPLLKAGFPLVVPAQGIVYKPDFSLLNIH
jgi:hypothetical protein